MRVLMLKIFTILTLFCTGSSAFSAMPVNEYRTLIWQHKEYRAQAPLPFGSIRLIVVMNSHGDVESITLYTALGAVLLPKAAVVTLVDIGDPQISFNPNDISDETRTKNLTVKVEYGESRRVDLGNVPNCGNPCVDYERPIASFVIDQNLEVIRTGGIPSK